MTEVLLSPGHSTGKGSSEPFQLLFQHARDVILFIRQEDGRILDANQAAEKTYGYTREELLALHISDLFPSAVHSDTGAQTYPMVADGVLSETFHLGKNGVLFPVEANFIGADMDGVGVSLAIIRDISERKTAVLALEKVNRALRTLSECNQILIRAEEESELLQRICQAVIEFGGYRLAWVGYVVADVNRSVRPVASAGENREYLDQFRISWADNELGQGPIGTAIRSGKPVSTRNILTDPRCAPWREEARLRGYQSSLALPLKVGGEVIGAFNIYAAEADAFDQDELALMVEMANDLAYGIHTLRAREVHRQAEEALRASESRFRSLFENMLNGYAFCKMLYEEGVPVDYINLEVNAAFEKLTSLQGAEGKKISEVLPGLRETNPELFEIYGRVASTGVPEKFELFVEPMGMWFSISVYRPVQDHFVVVFDNITERKEAEKALRENEERYRLLFASGNDAVFVYPILEGGRPGKFSDVNEIACQRMGYTRDELLQMSFRDINPPGFSVQNRGLLEQLIQEGQLLVSANHRARDGRNIPVEVNSRTFLICEQRNVISVARDISERVKADEKISSQIARLSALRAIDQSILSAKDLNQTLDILLEKTMQTLGVDAANFLLYDAKNQTLKIAAGRGIQREPAWPAGTPVKFVRSDEIDFTPKIEFIADLSQHPDRLEESLKQTGEAFTSYLGIPLEAKGELKGMLQLYHRTRLEPNLDWFDFLRALSDQAAIAIDNAQLFQALIQSNEELTAAYHKTIEGWARALDLRDQETEGHSRRVTELTDQLSKQIGVEEDKRMYLKWGALLHDIGKVGVPDEILFKPGPLNEKEWEIMRNHPLYAADLLLAIDFLHPAVEIPYCHHEKWDGTGYPQGLRGEDIPLGARIFAVVDVWDALTSDRPYRPAWPREKAVAYIREQAGKHFDPDIAAVFLKFLEN